MPQQRESLWQSEEVLKRVWVVAKGPSCLRLADHLRDDDAIASVNEGAMHIADRQIDFVFFSEITALDRVEADQHRIKQFISREPLDAQIAKYPEWMRDRWVYYGVRECDGDRESLHRRLVGGGICHHHTTPGAIHYLAKYTDYDEIAVIGADGGKQYAEGKTKLCAGFSPDLDEWAIITRRVGDLCSKVYAKKVQFYA